VVYVEEALFYFENQYSTIHTSDIDLESYNKKYRGYLFCPTELCDAKLVFVLRTSKPSYFRTWKGHNHNESCLYHFERIANKTGKRTEETISVQMSNNQKRNALKEAYELSQLTDEDLERRKQLSEKRKRTKKKPITSGKEATTQLEISLNDEDFQSSGELKQRQPRLLKRNINTLTQTDIGKPRVLTGVIEQIIEDESTILMKIYKGNKMVSVKFEEAFFANSPNYKGLFYHITEFIADQDGIFVGIGEVRISSKEDNYEFIVYHGDEFSINNLNLLTIASYYS
jgi:hypothetical protein